jgi:hypothetical protein
VPLEQAYDFLRSYTLRCEAENAQAVACALLTVRETPVLVQFLEFVLKECSKFHEAIVNWFCTCVRKEFEWFSRETKENVQQVFNSVCEHAFIGTFFRVQLAGPIVAAYDTGCLTRANFQLMNFLTGNVSKYLDMWCEPDLCSVLFVIKFLRFYQDTRIFMDNPHRGALDVKASRELLNQANTLCVNFSAVFVALFQRVLPLIGKQGFREVMRILYDARTTMAMQVRLPALYQLMNQVAETEIIATYPHIIQLMLPYPKLCALLRFHNNFQKESPVDALRILFDRPGFVDPDLILTDLVRTYVQSPDYASAKDEDRYAIIQALFKRAREKFGASLPDRPRSFISALTADILYINPALLNDAGLAKKTLSLAMPVFFLVRDPSMQHLSASVLDAICERLKHGDHPQFKKASFRELVNYVRKANIIPNITEYLMHTAGSESTKNELQALFKPKDTDQIPQQVLNFQRNNGQLDSPGGQEAIKVASEAIFTILTKYQAALHHAIPPILLILDTLIPRDRAGLNLVLDGIDPFACAAFCMRRLEDAAAYLQWAGLHRSFSAFNETGNALNLSAFVDALVRSISERSGNWEYFVTECPAFRSRLPIVQAICNFCKIARVIKFAELPLLPPDNSTGFYGLLFSSLSCGNWESDAQIKLTYLLVGRFGSPRDFASWAEQFVACFPTLPAAIRMFFEAEFSQVVCTQVSHIIDMLLKSGKEGAAEFCERVSNAWMSVKGPLKGAKPSPLSVDAVLL